MAFKYNPLSGQIEDQQQGPQGPTGLITTNAEVGSGSASEPAYSFSGADDGDTGIYRVAANKLGLATGGNNRLTINADGHVGIDTDNPKTPLHVYVAGDSTGSFGGGYVANSVIRIEDDSDNNNYYHGLELRSKRYGDTRILAQDRDDGKADLTFWLDNGSMQNGSLSQNVNEVVRFTYDGKVGIGTTTPDHLLHIRNGGSNPTAVIRLESIGTNPNSGDTLGSIEFEHNKTGAAGVATEIVSVVDANGTGAAGFQFKTGTGGAATTKLIIQSDGKVGINIPSDETPDTTALDATGNDTAAYDASADHRGKAQLIARNRTVGSDKFSSIGLVTGGGVQAAASLNLVHSGTDYLGHLTVKQRTGGSSFAERLRLDKDGNVGIGTTTPSHKLTVNQSNSGGIAAIHLPQDESTILGPYANTHLKMGGNILLGANGQIDLATSGTSRLTIKNNGKVSIGEVDAHTYNAHVAVDDLVVGGSSSHGITIVTGNTSTGSLWFDAQDATRGYIQYAHNEQALILGTEGNERLRITSDGGVVIRHNGASASDGYAGLEVRADKDKHQLVLASNSAVANDNRATLGFKVHNSGQNERIKGAIIVEGTGGGYGQADYMSFCLDSAGDNGNADTTADEKLRIISDGKVGIGESSPTSQLHVKAASQNNDYGLIQAETTNNNTRCQIHLKGKESDGTEVKTVLGGDGDWGGMLYTKTNHALGFATNNAAPQMVLDTSGNLGIGTDSPSKKLVVVSPAHDNGVEILAGGNGQSTSLLLQGKSTGGTEYNYTISSARTGYFGISDGTSTLFAIKDGKVGIGTTSPNEWLTIYSNTSSGNTALKIHNDHTSNAAQLILEGKRTESNNDSGQLIFKNNGYVTSGIYNYSGGSGNHDGGKLVFKTSAVGTVDAVTQALEIDTDGDTRIPNDKYLKFGTNNNLKIRHASGNNYINSASGSLYIQAGGNDALEIESDKTTKLSHVLALKNISTSSTNPGSEHTHIHADSDVLNINAFGGSGEIKLKTGSSGNVALTLNSSQNATFAGIINLGANKGIMFHPHDQSPTAGGSDSNLLDDYEEGTFTPTFNDLHGDEVSDITINQANYTKIGRLVHINVKLTTAAGLTDGSHFSVSVPFTPITGRENIFTAIASGAGEAFGLKLTGDSSNAQLYELKNYNWKTYTDFANRIIWITGAYEAA